MEVKRFDVRYTDDCGSWNDQAQVVALRKGIQNIYYLVGEYVRKGGLRCFRGDRSSLKMNLLTLRGSGRYGTKLRDTEVPGRAFVP